MSVVRQSKITKWMVLAGLGEKGLMSSPKHSDFPIMTCIYRIATISRLEHLTGLKSNPVYQTNPVSCNCRDQRCTQSWENNEHQQRNINKIWECEVATVIHLLKTFNSQTVQNFIYILCLTQDLETWRQRVKLNLF